MFRVLLIGIGALLMLFAGTVTAREQINIVGSSTIYPFATVVAEHFGKKSSFKTPKIESTGSGGGFKLFCEGLGPRTPDVTNASRRIKQNEIDKCHKNGVTEIIETQFGYDGIVFANTKSTKPLTVSLQQIYLALAKDVPNPDGSETFIPNPYMMWSDIDASLAKVKIEVMGPPPTSGTRDAFVELAMEGGCEKFIWLKAIKKKDPSVYKSRCHTIREDGHYIETGENDNLIVQKLKANPNTFGIFGYSFLDQNLDSVQSAKINGVPASFDAIVDGSYPISRTLYFYTKKAHINVIPGIKEYLSEFMAEDTAGEDGYLIDKGMLPLSMEGRRKQRNMITKMIVLPNKI